MLPTICMPSTAAWAAPRPGIMPVKLPEKTAAPKAFMVFNFGILIESVIVCLGTSTLSLRDVTSVLTPNSPDSMALRD